MFSIKAVSIAPVARDWLSNTNHPRFLHIFDHACNLINERGEVLSIVSPQIGNGPFNLVAERNGLFTDHLDSRCPIHIRTDQINLGSVAIDMSNAPLWSPRPGWKKLHTMRYKIFIKQISSMNVYQKRVLPLPTIDWDFGPLALKQKSPLTDIQSLVSNFSCALANAEIPTAKWMASQLAGLGPGLTPAGDDFILGAVLAAWIVHPAKVAKKLAKEVTEIAAPLTTSLSSAWLLSAGRGEAGILWHDLFDALLSEDRAALWETVDALLAVGHTSGADAMAGFFNTITQWAEKEYQYPKKSS